MRLKFATAIIVAMLMVMPVTHWLAWKHGRVSDYRKVTATLGVTAERNVRVGDYIYTKDGVFPTLPVSHMPPISTCDNCHSGEGY